VVAEVAMVALLSQFIFWGGVPAAHAENELRDTFGDRVRPELVQPECLAKQCSAPIKKCTDSTDCVKGLACTAKCMGDAQCTVGCFARYWSEDLDNVLSCAIEDAGCIKIGVVTPGPDSCLTAPKPPRPIIPQTPASLQGKWYKVMGWNSIYDCYECQLNSFTKPSIQQDTMNVKPNAVDIEVTFSMPRERIGQPAQTLKQTIHEQLVFDTAAGSHRTASTVGKMFGLTFWENWYIIGENSVAEAPFKFVYYTGKTVQNRYEGAFVYARKPELPQSAMPSIYRLAREAGLDPEKFCVIDNKCFAEKGGASKPPPFTPVANAAEGVARSAAPDTKPMSTLDDFTEFIEDPRPPARAMFSKLKQMGQMMEYDADGVHFLPRGPPLPPGQLRLI